MDLTCQLTEVRFPGRASYRSRVVERQSQQGGVPRIEDSLVSAERKHLGLVSFTQNLHFVRGSANRVFLLEIFKVEAFLEVLVFLGLG